jgi:hypothetical protein
MDFMQNCHQEINVNVVITETVMVNVQQLLVFLCYLFVICWQQIWATA